MLTVSIFMFSIKTCSLYVTLLVLHYFTLTWSRTILIPSINLKLSTRKQIKRTNTKQLTKSSAFVFLFVTISSSVVAHHLYPISHRDMHTTVTCIDSKVTCMWGHGGRSGTNVESSSSSSFFVHYRHLLWTWSRDFKKTFPILNHYIKHVYYSQRCVFSSSG